MVTLSFVIVNWVCFLNSRPLSRSAFKKRYLNSSLCFLSLILKSSVICISNDQPVDNMLGRPRKAEEKRNIWMRAIRKETHSNINCSEAKKVSFLDWTKFHWKNHKLVQFLHTTLAKRKHKDFRGFIEQEHDVETGHFFNISFSNTNKHLEELGNIEKPWYIQREHALIKLNLLAAFLSKKSNHDASPSAILEQLPRCENGNHRWQCPRSS